MSGIEERIEHALVGKIIDPAEWGGEYRLTEDDARHLAGALVAELGLTEEWAVQNGFGGSPMHHGGPNTARYLAAGDALGPGTTLISRHVTVWQEHSR